MIDPLQNITQKQGTRRCPVFVSKQNNVLKGVTMFMKKSSQTTYNYNITL